MTNLPGLPFVREAGDGPAVVLLHASASNSGQWRALTERLASRFRVLACDMSGCGRSPAFPREANYTLEEELRFLAPVFEAAGERFHLVGHSTGGAVAIKVALRHATRVRSLTVFEPVLFSLLVEAAPRGEATREILGLAQSTTDSAERGDLAAGAREFVDYWFGAGRWASMREEARAPILATMPLTGARWGAVFDDPARLADLRRLHMPALVLYAQHTRAPARMLSELLARTLPNARAAEIGGVGHMAPLTHPELVNPLVESFLVGQLSRPNPARKLEGIF